MSRHVSSGYFRADFLHLDFIRGLPKLAQPSGTRFNSNRAILSNSRGNWAEMKHSNTTHIHKSLSDQRAWAESHSMGFLNKSLVYWCPVTLYNTPNHTGSTIETLREGMILESKWCTPHWQVCHFCATKWISSLCVWLIRRSSIGSTDGVCLVDRESVWNQ